MKILKAVGELFKATRNIREQQLDGGMCEQGNPMSHSLLRQYTKFQLHLHEETVHS